MAYRSSVVVGLSETMRAGLETAAVSVSPKSSISVLAVCADGPDPHAPSASSSAQPVHAASDTRAARAVDTARDATEPA
jgi:hypothetical protein